MKKFFYSIAFLIFLFIPFRVSASYLPPTLPNTSVIPDFLSTVAQNEIVNDSNIYSAAPDINNINMIVNGRSISDSMQYRYIDNSTILTSMEFYDSNGNLVPQADTYTVFGNSDVSPFMFVADKNSGEMLYQEIGGNLYSTLVGGSDLSVSFPEFIVRDLGMSGANNINRILDAVNVAKQEDMIVYGNTLTNSDKEFLSENRFYCRYESEWVTFFVPNACSTETLVRDNNNHYSVHATFGVYDRAALTYTPVVYTTNPSNVYFGAGDSRYTGLISQSNSVFGTTFSYASRYRNTVNPLYSGTGSRLDMELPTQAQYNQYKNTVGDSVYLIPVEEVTDEPDQNIYNYTYIIENPPSRIQTINNSYNYEGDTNYNNYPVYYNYEYPTYPSNYEYVTNIYNYYTTPSQGESIGQIDDENITDNIPILNNLRYRFPFSIPFDIYNLVSGLAVDRQAPHFEWYLYFPVIDYTWEIDFDLSAWDTQAGIFRTCFLILFIIALAMWAYNHFFGN